MAHLLEVKRANAEKYQAHLVRLIKAAGQTLISHAAELIATKPGTADFQILIRFPQNPEGVAAPTVEVRQTFVSDEAAAVALDWPEPENYNACDKEEKPNG